MMPLLFAKTQNLAFIKVWGLLLNQTVFTNCSNLSHMIGYRKHGLRNLYSLFILLCLLLWFVITVVVSVEVFDKIKYTQINFPLYMLGICVAAFISHHYLKSDIPRGDERFLWVEAIRQTNFDIAVTAFILFTIVFATKDKAMSRIFLGSYLLSSWFVLVCVNRHINDLLARWIFTGEYTVNTILVGSKTAASRLEKWADSQKALGVNIIGLVSTGEKSLETIKFSIVGDISNLENIIEEYHIQQIVLLETRQSPSYVKYIADTCRAEGCRLLVFNHWEEYFDEPMKVVSEGDYTFFTNIDEPLQDPVNRLLKRGLDIAVSLPVVLFILPPLCLVVKIMQKIQAPGPLFYKQMRTGFEQTEFPIYKFRSLTHTVENKQQEAKQVTSQDKRVYPFGRFIRRTSIDEFPQFINVLRGQMSVVGPRPHMITHDDEFSRYVDVYRNRHFVKPGITGLAQQRGYRGEIKDHELLRNRVRLDLEYIYSWSIWLDIMLIVKTMLSLIFPPKSAY